MHFHLNFDNDIVQKIIFHGSITYNLAYLIYIYIYFFIYLFYNFSVDAVNGSVKGV